MVHGSTGKVINMIYYDSAKKTVRDREDAKITKVTIDMTGWISDDPELVKRGTYPYVIDFVDPAGVSHRGATDGYKSGAFKQLLDDAGERFHASFSNMTVVEVIAPTAIMERAGYEASYVGHTTLSDLGKHGMDVFNVEFPNDAKIMPRLQTCLDEAVHQAWLYKRAIIMPDKKVFPKSINHYEYSKLENAEYWPEYYAGN